jgi:hypothetical protein
MLCRHCGDPLPADAPPSVTSCTSYANWRARQAGDMLQADEAAMRTVFKGLCAGRGEAGWTGDAGGAGRASRTVPEHFSSPQNSRKPEL